MKLYFSYLIAFLPTKEVAATLRSNHDERKLAGTFYVNEYGPGGYCTDVGTPVPGSRTFYNTMEECCVGQYNGQPDALAFCYSKMPNPPTSKPTEAPTEAGTLTVWYPDYSTSWIMGKCINDGPLPSGRAAYTTQAECCEKAYGGQASRACVSDFQDPPTQAPTESPTEEGTLTVYYPVWNEAGFCTNDPPSAHGLGTINGRNTYTTMADCCSKEFSHQTDGFCYSKMANPPTQAPTETPTEAGTLTVYYPVYSEAEGFCTNDPPSVHGLSTLNGISTHTSHSECCTKHFGWQKSGYCFSQMANPPTQAPTESSTEAGTLNEFYPIRNQAKGFCTNEPPSTYGLNGIYEQSFPTMAECCKAYFSFQADGFCYSKMANAPTQAPTGSSTEAGTLTEFYPIRNQGSGFCTNEPPSTYGLNGIYEKSFPTMAECCKAYFSFQADGFCYSKMASPPTQAPTDPPTEAGSLLVWYPDYTKSWDKGVCINASPLPSYATHYNYATQAECCGKAYAGQMSQACATAAGLLP